MVCKVALIYLPNKERTIEEEKKKMENDNLMLFSIA
jgi:hypothetical protein